MNTNAFLCIPHNLLCFSNWEVAKHLPTLQREFKGNIGSLGCYQEEKGRKKERKMDAIFAAEERMRLMQQMNVTKPKWIGPTFSSAPF